MTDILIEDSANINEDEEGIITFSFNRMFSLLSRS